MLSNDHSDNFILGVLWPNVTADKRIKDLKSDRNPKANVTCIQ